MRRGCLIISFLAEVGSPALAAMGCATLQQTSHFIIPQQFTYSAGVTQLTYTNPTPVPSAHLLSRLYYNFILHIVISGNSLFLTLRNT